MTAPTSSITCESIFERYHLPQLLQTHLWRTASLMELLLNHWQGPTIEKELLIESMLLHDLGNLVKFDLSETTPILLFSAEELPVYRALQSDWHQKYGKNVDVVTAAFIKELRLEKGPAIIELITTHSDGSTTTAVTEGLWEQKLYKYVDFRIAPHGLVTLQERFDDLGKRYLAREGGWDTAAKVAEKLAVFTAIETKLQTHITLNLAEIPAADLEPITRWKDYRFSVIPE